MTTKTLFSSACIGALAMLCLQPANLHAQASPSGTLTAIITSASGAERHLLSYQNTLDRVGLGPNQVVTVTLQFSSDARGESVLVAPIDGGEASADDGMDRLLVGGDGTAVFYYQAGLNPGLYRLMVQLGVNDYRLEFWVLDVEHPQNNPPRVQIVN